MGGDAAFERGVGILTEVRSSAEALYERHLARSKEWFPYDVGEDGAPAPPPPESVTVDPATAAALQVNLLTEDNLPYYLHDLMRFLGGVAPVYVSWARRWTAEEARHSIALRGYLVTTRAVDLVALERARMAHMWAGYAGGYRTHVEAVTYAAVQELATRIAHRNTAKRLPDPWGRALFANVVADENLHHLFYRDLCKAIAEVDPSTFVTALERQVATFAMPGTAIPDFTRLALTIARARIYSLDIFADQVLRPLVETHWRIAELDGLDGDAEAARDRLLSRIERIRRLGERLAARAESQASPSAREGVPA